MGKIEFEKTLEANGFELEDGLYCKMDDGLKICVDVYLSVAFVSIHVGGTVLSDRFQYSYFSRGWDRAFLRLLIKLGEEQAFARIRTWRQLVPLIGGRLSDDNGRRAVCTAAG